VQPENEVIVTPVQTDMSSSGSGRKEVTARPQQLAGGCCFQEVRMTEREVENYVLSQFIVLLPLWGLG